MKIIFTVLCLALITTAVQATEVIYLKVNLSIGECADISHEEVCTTTVHIPSPEVTIPVILEEQDEILSGSALVTKYSGKLSFLTKIIIEKFEDTYTLTAVMINPKGKEFEAGGITLKDFAQLNETRFSGSIWKTGPSTWLVPTLHISQGQP